MLVLPLVMLSGAWAAETVEVEEVVVTASRLAEPLEETTSGVIVITAEEIEASGAQLVPEVLRKVADLNITQNGGPGKTSEVLMRGGAPRHTLVMVDGVKVNSPTTGGFDFAGLDVRDIERIEIVKGPQSTMYGSEAIAGVINIITKKGRGKPRVTASVEGGSFGTFKPSLGVSGSSGALDYRFNASYLRTDGISAVRVGTEDDGYENVYFSGKVGARLGEKAEVEVAGNYYYDRTELDRFDFFLGPVDDLFYVTWGHHHTVSGKLKLYLVDRWEQVITVSRASDLWRSRNPGVAFLNSDIETFRDTVEWQHNLFLTDGYTLTAGVEYREEEGENTGNFNRTIDNLALYLNNKLSLFDGALVLNAGVRNDDHETFGSETTYRVGALVNLEDSGLRIRGSYGTGFRAPSFNELFFPFFGNPDLKPEESEAWEAALEKDFGERVTASVAYFHQEYENLIEFDPSTFLAGNVAEARVEGVETGVTVHATDRVDVGVHYTHLDAEDETTGGRLNRRPEDKVVVTADYSGEGFSLNADYVYVGEVFDVPAGRDLDAYSLVNVAGSYDVTDNLALFARIENLFDEDYETAGDFNSPGFSVYGGIKAEF
jgi:vitamin B12 transporter